MGANEQTDERVAQYLRLGFWLIWPTVNREKIEKNQEKRLTWPGEQINAYRSSFDTSPSCCFPRFLLDANEYTETRTAGRTNGLRANLIETHLK